MRSSIFLSGRLTVEIGILAEAAAADRSAPLYLRKHRIRSGEQTITVVVPRMPAQEGVEPHHFLIERPPEDDRRPIGPDK